MIRYLLFLLIVRFVSTNTNFPQHKTTWNIKRKVVEQTARETWKAPTRAYEKKKRKNGRTRCGCVVWRDSCSDRYCKLRKQIQQDYSRKETLSLEWVCCWNWWNEQQGFQVLGVCFFFSNTSRTVCCGGLLVLSLSPRNYLATKSPWAFVLLCQNDCIKLYASFLWLFDTTNRRTVPKPTLCTILETSTIWA